MLKILKKQCLNLTLFKKRKKHGILEPPHENIAETAFLTSFSAHSALSRAAPRSKGCPPATPGLGLHHRPLETHQATEETQDPRTQRPGKDSTVALGGHCPGPRIVGTSHLRNFVALGLWIFLNPLRIVGTSKLSELRLSRFSETLSASSEHRDFGSADFQKRSPHRRNIGTSQPRFSGCMMHETQCMMHDSCLLYTSPSPRD